MRSARLPVLLAICLLVGVMLVAAGPGIADGVGIDDEIENPDTPILVYDIAIDESGTANWTVTAKFPIGDEDQREAFEVIADEYMDGEEDNYLSAEAYEIAAAELESTLDRPMEITDENRSIARSESVGELQLSFEWTGFAAADNHTVTIGDVFTTTDRPWLSTLQENEYLRLHAPSGYAIDTSGMPVHNRTAWMNGPADLSGAELQTVFVREAMMPENGSDNDGNNDPSSAMLPLLGGAIGALGILAVMILIGYFAGWAPVAAAVSAIQRDVEEATDETVPDHSAPVAEEIADDEEVELLSDEERVLALIDERGGRMKQAAIVEETDWSNAKVSQLLSEMAESGEVEKLRIGRENLISLPEYENGR